MAIAFWTFIEEFLHMYEVMQSSPAEKVALLWWNIL